MKTGGMVWIYPFGNKATAIDADVDLISSNGKSIALRLRDKPSWFRIDGGVFLHKRDGRIEMLLMRNTAAGPWVDTATGAEYEITEAKP